MLLRHDLQDVRCKIQTIILMVKSFNWSKMWRRQRWYWATVITPSQQEPDSTSAPLWLSASHRPAHRSILCPSLIHRAPTSCTGGCLAPHSSVWQRKEVGHLRTQPSWNPSYPTTWVNILRTKQPPRFSQFCLSCALKEDKSFLHIERKTLTDDHRKQFNIIFFDTSGRWEVLTSFHKEQFQILLSLRHSYRAGLCLLPFSFLN